MLKFKEAVRLYSLKPELVIALLIADQVCAEYDTECLINSVNDGKHGQSSFHYNGLAFDLDTHDGSGAGRYCKFPVSASVAADEIRNRLPPDFDVIFESSPGNEHIHIEYQPKRANRL